jgi:hypothetical protein
LKSASHHFSAAPDFFLLEGEKEISLPPLNFDRKPENDLKLLLFTG